MNSILKISLLAGVYILALVLIYQVENSDLMLVFLSLSLMVPVIYLVHDRYRQKEKISKLQEETLKAELNLLKSQINPHFFFNTLNNLYGLAVEKSDLTQEVIYKLSEMMRFTIYEGRKHTVSVKDEIAYLENFIELHQIRQKRAVDIRFEKEIEDEKQRIPPLLFINLLENAFKHGVNTLIEGAYIHFTLKTHRHFIHFEMENNFEPLEKPSKRPGIGIENLKRRLALLFPGKHTFTNSRQEKTYTTTVTITLR
ncbi:sensor histidine kinase [Rapidithrix thailandica]|uniref:Sensor histidine kinase n=1 Tax=Rapidithrix thailandica TaxID=413964 RepID=A0AAW9S369_9BACT